jgi:hypothetical protein
MRNNIKYEGIFYSIDPFDLNFLIISNPKISDNNVICLYNSTTGNEIFGIRIS